MPSRRVSFATVIALLFTCFTHRQAKRKSSSCSGVGCARRNVYEIEKRLQATCGAELLPTALLLADCKQPRLAWVCPGYCKKHRQCPHWTLSQALPGTVATPSSRDWRPRMPSACTHEKPCSSWACVHSTPSFVHRHACPGPDLLLRHHGELDVLRRQRIGLLLQPAACRSACTHRIRGITQGPLRARSRPGARHGANLMRVCSEQRMTAATAVAGHCCCEGRTAGAHPWFIA